jgi:hypothetical protein
VITLDDVLALVAVDSVSRNERALATLVHQRLLANPALDVERIGDITPHDSWWRDISTPSPETQRRRELRVTCYTAWGRAI